MLPPFYQACLSAQLSQIQLITLTMLVALALWFPIVKYWLKTHFKPGKRLLIVIDRTQWKHHNLLMVSVVYQKRTIPLDWQGLNQQGQSSLAEQKAVLRPVFTFVRRYRSVVVGDPEFHTVALANWLRQQQVHFVLRLPRSTTVEPFVNAGFTRLDELPQFPGIALFEVQVQVPQQQGFGPFNLVTRWRRVYRDHQANEVWYLLTNLESLEVAL